MSREVHVQFSESLGVRFPWATQHGADVRVIVSEEATPVRVHSKDGRSFEDKLKQGKLDVGHKSAPLQIIPAV